MNMNTSHPMEVTQATEIFSEDDDDEEEEEEVKPINLNIFVPRASKAVVVVDVHSLPLR